MKKILLEAPSELEGPNAIYFRSLDEIDGYVDEFSSSFGNGEVIFSPAGTLICLAFETSTLLFRENATKQWHGFVDEDEGSGNQTFYFDEDAKSEELKRVKTHHLRSDLAKYSKLTLLVGESSLIRGVELEINQDWLENSFRVLPIGKGVALNSLVLTMKRRVPFDFHFGQAPTSEAIEIEVPPNEDGKLIITNDGLPFISISSIHKKIFIDGQKIWII